MVEHTGATVVTRGSCHLPRSPWKGSPVPRGLYATHDTIRQILAFYVGFGVVLMASSLIAPTVGLLAVPLGYAAGMAVKIVLLALFLWPRVRAIGRPEPPALISPGSAPAGSGRA